MKYVGLLVLVFPPPPSSVGVVGSMLYSYDYLLFGVDYCFYSSSIATLYELMNLTSAADAQYLS